MSKQYIATVGAPAAPQARQGGLNPAELQDNISFILITVIGLTTIADKVVEKYWPDSKVNNLIDVLWKILTFVSPFAKKK